MRWRSEAAKECTTVATPAAVDAFVAAFGAIR
jgi:hypothetical protein